MKVALVLVIVLAAPAPVFGDAEVLVPWNEFKALYRESIEREIMKKAPKPSRVRQVHSIDEARYLVTVEGEDARAEVVLSGKVVSGGPEPIPLFGTDAVITDIECTVGGSLVGIGEKGGVALLPDGPPGEFQVTASLLVRTGESEDARAVSFDIPRALRNSLDLVLPPETRLAEEPGIADAQGTYCFAGRPALTIAYIDEKGLAAATETELDAISRIRVQRSRVFVSTHFLPLRPLPGPLVLRAPEGAKYVASSFRASRIKSLGGDRYGLDLPAGNKLPLWVEFALDTAAGGDSVEFVLPAIEGNQGQQGRFVVAEPDDVQVTVTADGLVNRIPVERLGQVLANMVAEDRFYARVPPDAEIALGFRRYEAVPTPATVLPCQYLFSSFEENGNVLSTLMFDVPPDVGSRLRLAAVPGAHIWSLTVNKTPRKVYAGEEEQWVIPLESGVASRVELSYLVEGPKLGLHGRLETQLPATGLASRDVRVGIALPPRIDLLNVEGPVSSDRGEGWDVPDGITGKTYRFSRSFYNGEGMKLAISYKEPVDYAREAKGGPR